MEIIPLADREDFVWEIANLHDAEWNHLDPSLSLNKRVESIMNTLGRNGIPSFFVAVMEDQFVGSAALVQNDLESRPHLSPWLAAVYVRDEYRNRGIATKLIARCENEAVQSGFDTLYLSTERACLLYEKLGWANIEQCDCNGVMLNIMSKKLM